MLIADHSDDLIDDHGGQHIEDHDDLKNLPEPSPHSPFSNPRHTWKKANIEDNDHLSSYHFQHYDHHSIHFPLITKYLIITIISYHGHNHLIMLVMILYFIPLTLYHDFMITTKHEYCDHHRAHFPERVEVY